MKNAVRQMGAYSLHYYTLPSGSFETKTRARILVQPSGPDYHAEAHAQDRRDGGANTPRSWTSTIRRKKVGLYVDEWGTWVDVEPGTNPGFLFQQNTMRDALVAGQSTRRLPRPCRSRAYGEHRADGQRSAGDGPDRQATMLLTLMYHVLEMYKPFQNATLLPTELTTPEYKLGEVAIPAVSVSAARGADGAMVLSLVNTDPNKPARVTANIRGSPPRRKMSARVLTTPRHERTQHVRCAQRREAGGFYRRQGKRRWLGVRVACKIGGRGHPGFDVRGLTMNVASKLSALLCRPPRAVAALRPSRTGGRLFRDGLLRRTSRSAWMRCWMAM